MGWMTTFKPKGEPLRDFFIRKGALTWNSDSPHRYTVLETCGRMGEFYAAVERIDGHTGKREVFCLVFLTEYLRNQPSGHNFAWKDMDETMDPYICNPGEKILNLLTPTDNENANAWRARARKALEKMKAITIGTRLKLYQRIYKIDDILGARGFWVIAEDTGQSYRMTLGQARKAELLKPEVA